ncbi:MAG TPA: HNH endonuclease signature motif containing protein, partial [Actinomycetes bacterium]|nr:HNH endonuclease signature motif containing protein [Actinomycetes bacterium]
DEPGDSYRPSAGLTRLIKTRDQTCRFPGCRRSAVSKGMDLDHTIPWPDGPTAAWNLAVLCRSHHVLKTHSDWKVQQLAGGVLEWTTPSGRVFTTKPADYRSGAPPGNTA